MHEILGTSPLAPLVFGNAAPDSGNSEILAIAGTPEQKERYLHPLLAGDLKSAFSMTEPDTAGSDPTLLQTRAIARRRRLGDQRPQVVLVQRLDRRLPDRDGGHRPRRQATPARFDARSSTPTRRACTIVRDVATMEHPYEQLRPLRQPRRDPLRGRPGPGASAARRRGGWIPDRAAAPLPGPHPPLHALAGCRAARVRHALRALAVPLRARRDARQARDRPELDRRLRGRDAGRAADDAARGVEDGHRGRARPRARRSR